ncbi:MAG: DUF4003 family protein [Oscillospiraceae bacterium]|nr:DUF4003 family protein [Oscillospiraceae bacterium]
MVEQLQMLCENFIRNRDIIKDEFKWDNQYIIPVCACTFTEKGVIINAERLKQCQKLLKENTGVFSDFRSSVELPMITMLAADADPAKRLSDTLAIYDIIKRYFRGGSYTALISAMVSGMTTVQNAEQIAARGKAIHGMMKQAHPFLTDGEDSVFAVLMAFSPKNDQQLFEDMEACYSLLRKIAGDSNSAQRISHVLALYEGAPEEKCARVKALYDMLARSRRKYGKYYELSVLACLAMTAPDLNEAAAQVAHADNFLDRQKGYSGLGIDKKTRTMHAAMLTSCLYQPNRATEAALAGAIARLAAQQTAMCALIATNAAT